MNIHNSLLTLDQDLKPVPDLAKKWEVSPDGLIYTFRLHDGMKFHDGTDMDAEAVKWNFEHMMEPKTKSAVHVFYMDVKAVEVVRQQTVRFVLNEPNYMFPPIVGGYCYGFVVSSPTAFKTMSEQEYRMKPVGTSPFKFLEHVPNDRLVLVRNERYFKKDLPYLDLDKVVFKVLTGPMTQVSGLRADVFGENRGDGRSRRTFREPLHPYTQALLSAIPSARPSMVKERILRSGVGLTAPENLGTSFELVIWFTWVHVLVFVVLGSAASWLLRLAERDPNFGFGILLFLVVFMFGFIGVSLVFAEEVLHALAWPTILIGNLLAAGTMAWYFWRRHPQLTIWP